MPDTWVTDYSGDIGNTLAPKGEVAGSSLQVSSSKNPRSYFMKVTSQMRSSIWRIPTFWPAKTVLRLTFCLLKQIRPQVVTVTVLSWNG